MWRGSAPYIRQTGPAVQRPDDGGGRMTPRRVPTLIGITLATAVAMVFLFGMYTVPNHGGPAYGDLADLLERALGDSAAPLPGPPRTLPVQPIGAESGRSPQDWPPRPESDSGPTAWLAGAIAADLAAIRAWLGPAVLSTSSSRGDTVRTVFWRLSLRHGCRLVSRLEATSVGRTTGTTRFIALASNCPGPASR